MYIAICYAIEALLVDMVHYISTYSGMVGKASASDDEGVIRSCLSGMDLSMSRAEW